MTLEQYLVVQVLFLVAAGLVVRDVRALRRTGAEHRTPELDGTLGWFVMVAVTGPIALAYYVWVRRQAARRAAASAAESREVGH